MQNVTAPALPGSADDVCGLSAGQAVAGLRDAVVAERSAVVAQLLLLTQLADLHPYDPDSRRGPGGEGALAVGDGGPDVGEFVVVDIAVALGICDASARIRLRQALELRHRHPRLWQAVVALQVPYWVATKVVDASHTAELTREQAGWVDEQFVRLLEAGDLPVGRLLGRVYGLVVRADLEGYERRRLAKLTERYARVGRSDGYGLKAFYAQIDAADAIFLDAVIDRLAEILADDPSHHTSSHDVRRAVALGLLGRPGAADELLRNGTRAPAQTTETADVQEPVAPDGPGAPSASPETPSQSQEPDPKSPFWASEPPEDPGPDRPSVDLPVDLELAQRLHDRQRHGRPPLPPEPYVCELCPPDPAIIDRIRSRTLTRVLGRADCPREVGQLGSRAVLYVHTSVDQLVTGDGIARIEQIGPATLAQIQHALAGCVVKVTPVINLHGTQYAVDSYEIPDRLRSEILLRHPYEVGPYGSRSSRSSSVDLDHTIAYAHDHPVTGPAPPGQTRSFNLGPLGRPTHRAKTHDGLRGRQIAPGAFLWQTAHGQIVLTDQSGNHDLGLTIRPDARSTVLPRAAEPGLFEDEDDWSPDDELAQLSMEVASAVETAELAQRTVGGG